MKALKLIASVAAFASIAEAGRMSSYSAKRIKDTKAHL